MSDNVDKLTEMGFSVEQATQALHQTGGDLSKAVDYLFGDPIEIDKPEPQTTGMTNYMDTVNISNPHEIPQLSYRGNEKGSYQYIEDDASGALQPNLESPAVKLTDNVDKREDGTPAVVILSKSNYLENYLIPIIMILSQSSWFRNIMMIDLDEIYEASSNPEQPLALRFLKELQHLIYFNLQLNRTQRKFLIGDELINNLPNDFKQALANDIESVDEVILRIFESLNYNFNLVIGNNELKPQFNQFQRTLQSVVESKSDDVRSGIYSVEIEPECRADTLYHTLNGLFWDHNFKKIGLMQYEAISPIITFQLMGESGESEEYDGISIQIDEEFYPEIYTEKCNATIIKMRNEELKLEELRKQVTANLLEVNFFEGKKVELVLQKSIDYMKDKVTIEVQEDLQQFNDDMNNERVRLLQQQDQLRTSMNENDLRNHENIITNYERDHEDKFEKYELQGIILTDARYYLKQSDSWFSVEVYSQTLSNRVSGCTVDAVEFNEVNEIIRNYTRRSLSEITLIYGKRGQDEDHTSIEYLEERFIKQEEEFNNKQVGWKKLILSPPNSPSSSDASSESSKHQKRQRKNEELDINDDSEKERIVVSDKDDSDKENLIDL